MKSMNGIWSIIKWELDMIINMKKLRIIIKNKFSAMKKKNKIKKDKDNWELDSHMSKSFKTEEDWNNKQE